MLSLGYKTIITGIISHPKMAIKVLTVLLVLGYVSGAPDFAVRISGGLSATSLQYPYQVSIQSGTTDFEHACGGAIISPSWIVTAAHCFSLGVAIGRVVAGLSDFTKVDDQIQTRTLDWLHIVIHPNFTDNIVNDIALLKLNKPFVFNDHVQPIRISKVPCVAEESVTFTGFGIINYGDVVVPTDTLRVTHLTPLPYEKCYGLLEPLYGTNMNYNEQMHVCAIGTSGPCVLDDGSPLVQDDRLIGVLSWLPAPCGTESIPTIFTRIGHYADFIKDNVDDLPSSTS